MGGTTVSRWKKGKANLLSQGIISYRRTKRNETKIYETTNRDRRQAKLPTLPTRDKIETNTDTYKQRVYRVKRGFHLTLSSLSISIRFNFDFDSISIRFRFLQQKPSFDRCPRIHQPNHFHLRRGSKNRHRVLSRVQSCDLSDSRLIRPPVEVQHSGVFLKYLSKIKNIHMRQK